MFSDSLDDLLRNDTASQGTDVVKFSATGSRTVAWSVHCLLLEYNNEAFVKRFSHIEFGDGVYLQLSRVFSNLGLDCLVLVFLNGSVCLFDKITRDLQGDAGELF